MSCVQTPVPAQRLDERAWHRQRAAHEARVGPWVEPRLARKSRGEKHPVDDFLFDYYASAPALLRRWHPGLGVALAGDSAREFLASPLYVETPAGITADPALLPARRREGMGWIRGLLGATLERTPQFACFGLHEWAMVYRAADTRHAAWPLRFERDELARIVERQPVCCSHFDAFRFFTPAARPLNRLQPTRPAQRELDQRGCLHVNMDLFKWSQKLAPFCASELAADCFALAREIRTLDMRASPYDLRGLGYEPVPIETPEGRADYETAQRAFAERAQPLRRRLLALVESILA